MKLKTLTLFLVLCLVLSGCYSWMDGSYSSSVLHHTSHNQASEEACVVQDESELQQVLSERVEKGAENVLINVANLEVDTIDQIMEQAISHVQETNPFGAYAVESIGYEMGTSGGQPALAVTIHYNQNHGALRNMTKAQGMEAASKCLEAALEQCDTKLVIYVEDYSSMDFQDYVRKFMEDNPHTVMELPSLTVSTFPDSGTSRVVEIGFAYQTGREALRIMQSRVGPLFTSAELYLVGNTTQYDQYEMLYAFLMERHDYQLEASITPSYSLLIHGVGNSKAFAVVYGAMCRRVGLECLLISGTYNGESRFWNMICVDGRYYHLDLVSSYGTFALMGDDEMSGYVWDYSAYPQCEPYSVAPMAE